jgi:choline-sulfatase
MTRMAELPGHLNLVLIVTDQERAPMHWPDGLVRERLVSRARLLRHGVSFENAVCNTAMCSPSRATFITGLMPAQHRVVDTLTTDGPVSSSETELSREIPNLASMLRGAGYEVQYRGKWHLSKGPTGGFDATPEDLAAYGFDGWVAPDAGGNTGPPNFGGGRADHDAAYVEQAASFLRERAAQDGQGPFCLVVSLVNPHDVLAFPREWTDDYTSDWLQGDVELPPSFDERLDANFKPTAHAMMGSVIDRAVGTLDTDEQRLQYLNFYANLVARIDRQIAPIIDCFYEQDGRPTRLGEETLIVRFSDHGEMAMAHGGLRQKAFNVYEESLRVPLIFSNPRLVPSGRACPHPASLVDIMPTVASILEVDAPPGLRGTDLAPMVRDPDTAPLQDEVLFTFDDMHAGTGLVREVLPGAPGHIRCIRRATVQIRALLSRRGQPPNRTRDVRPHRGPLRTREPRAPRPSALCRTQREPRTRPTRGQADAGRGKTGPAPRRLTPPGRAADHAALKYRPVSRKKPVNRRLLSGAPGLPSALGVSPTRQVKRQRSVPSGSTR